MHLIAPDFLPAQLPGQPDASSLSRAGRISLPFTLVAIGVMMLPAITQDVFGQDLEVGQDRPIGRPEAARAPAVKPVIDSAPTRPGQATKPPGSKESAKRDQMPKPRPVMLKTKDGVEIRAFYFPSDRGKEAITVLLVHEWQGQASPYLQLTLALRDAGCAVLIPDYRGHGGSASYTDQRGSSRRYDVSRMGKRDVANIITMDLETAKGFLKEENNRGQLNLNALVVIGIREGCIMAMGWASRDWSFPSVGRLKQGQDVKAIVMVSPDKQIKGVPIEPTLKDPNLLQLPILIVGGLGNPQAKETQRIARRIESIKSRAAGGKTTGFQLSMVDTSLTGPALVNETASVIPTIVDFVKDEVRISDDENPWIHRE